MKIPAIPQEINVLKVGPMLQGALDQIIPILEEGDNFSAERFIFACEITKILKTVMT